MNLFATPARIKNNRIENSLSTKLITDSKEYLVLDYEKQDNVNVILILQDNGIIDWYPMFGFRYRYSEEDNLTNLKTLEKKSLLKEVD
jgi:hypothetical protein